MLHTPQRNCARIAESPGYNLFKGRSELRNQYEIGVHNKPYV